jgi:hypothetical protein
MCFFPLELGGFEVGTRDLEQCCGSGFGIRCFFDPWIRNTGWTKNLNPDLGTRMNIQDHISEILETVFWVKDTEIL